MSFFDETDEPQPAPRTRRPSGTGRRPPGDQQAIMVRRAVAGVAILVVVILMVLGIHSCQVNSRNSALKSYNNSVRSLILQSDATGKTLFTLLSAGNAASKEQNLQTQLFTTKNAAQSELNQAQGLSVPDQTKTAQDNFLLTLSLRHDGISDIAGKIQQALTKTTAQDAVRSIALDMQEFLASGVVYTVRTAPEIAAALHAAGIAVGGASGETIAPTTFLPDLAWLTPSYIAAKLGASLPTSSSGTCPSICGHAVNSASVGGVALSTGGGNTIPASPAPTLSVNFTNTGENTETNVTVQVVVTTSSGTTITAQTVVPTTKAGQTYTTQVTLPKAPPTGTAQVKVTVEKVSGETNLANNTLTFPVTFD